jgi:hypothetical protein
MLQPSNCLYSGCEGFAKKLAFFVWGGKVNNLTDLSIVGDLLDTRGS